MMRQAAAAALAAAIVVAIAPICIAQRASAARFPQKLEQYLRSVVQLTRKEHEALAAGHPVTKLLDADEKTEVGVFGAIWIAAPIRRYVEAVNDIESFESGGGFKVTRRISSPPTLDDFADLKLPAGDVEDLRRCRVGDCEIKLGEDALRRFRSDVDWKSAGSTVAANALMRRIALEYVAGYLQRGSDALVIYRDRARPIDTAQEFRQMTDGMPELTTYLPALRQYLLDYPKTTLPGAASFLYWQETEFGLKPTIRISHLTIREGPDDTVVASRMLYASHYFWTALELRVLVPDPSRGTGFWFVTVSRSRSDGLTGFTGLFVRSRVRGEVRNGALAGLRTTKAKLERR
jgi:hypothetical protein